MTGRTYQPGKQRATVSLDELTGPALVVTAPYTPVIGRVHTHDLGFEGPAAPRNDASPDLDPAESIRLAHMCPWLTRPPSAANPIAVLAIRQMC